MKKYYLWIGPTREIPGKGIFTTGKIFTEDFFSEIQFKTFKKNKWIKPKKEK